MEKLLVTVDEACDVLGVRKTTLYKLVGDPATPLQIVKQGSRRSFLRTADIKAYVASLTSEAA